MGANMDQVMNHWEADRLEYESIAGTFTRLIQSINDAKRETKVISIEAGFGRGKTFFRTAWAQDLRVAGELVIEIDALQSDHSGDPVVAFLGAMLGMLPEEETTKREKAWNVGKKILSTGAKLTLNAVVRQGSEVIAEALQDDDAEKTATERTLDQIISDTGAELSNYMGGLIAQQLRADKARKEELPQQIATLFDILTEDSQHKRVVVLIDELDRCHPDYAIALLEAMKLVFGQKGFVFVLMVNADYLERIADRRFGSAVDGERYLDKFVDLRLQLPWTDDVLGRAVHGLTLDTLPEYTALGEGPEFSAKAAADLAQQLAPVSGLSMRQIKRVMTKVEIALRCHAEMPVDGPLLVFLAFAEAAGKDKSDKPKVASSFLPRAELLPEMKKRFYDSSGNFDKNDTAYRFINKNCPELMRLPHDRYPRAPNGAEFVDWAKIANLAETYIPSHTAMLNAVYLAPARA